MGGALCPDIADAADDRCRTGLAPAMSGVRRTRRPTQNLNKSRPLLRRPGTERLIDQTRLVRRASHFADAITWKNSAPVTSTCATSPASPSPPATQDASTPTSARKLSPATSPLSGLALQPKRSIQFGLDDLISATSRANSSSSWLLGSTFNAWCARSTARSASAGWCNCTRCSAKTTTT